MDYPPLVKYDSAVKYRQHFENIYCRGPLATFDGIQVRFGKTDFNHCFFETVGTKDDTFSFERAERVDWIKAALQDPSSELYVGWSRKKKKLDFKRRVAIVMHNYIVVISMKNKQNADFCTAYLAGTVPLKGRNFSTLDLIKTGPKWKI